MSEARHRDRPAAEQDATPAADAPEPTPEETPEQQASAIPGKPGLAAGAHLPDPQAGGPPLPKPPLAAGAPLPQPGPAQASTLPGLAPPAPLPGASA